MTLTIFASWVSLSGRTLCFFAALCMLTLLQGCTAGDRMFRESRNLMDTSCTITVVSPSRQEARSAIESGFEEIRKLEILLNYYSPESEISRVNNAAGISPVRVSAETLDVITRATEVAQASSGAFDPTIAPLVAVWDFSTSWEGRPLPAPDDIARARRLVDFRKIVIDGARSELYLREKGMAVDPGGIAKGYAADRAVAAIRKRGIKAALVAIAGDIRGYGSIPSGKGWRVGIQDPRPERPSEKPWEDIFARLTLTDRAISTSGDYQRFFTRNGKRYHHILDPQQGYPAASGLISVTVMASEGYLADSLSTAVFILGAEKGMRLLREMGAEGILVDSRKRVLVTDHLSTGLEIIRQAYTLANAAHGS